MPSPFAHGFVGYLLYRASRQKLLADIKNQKSQLPLLLAVLVLVSVLPDLDFVAGLLTGQMAAYHNNATHSLITGLLVSLGLAGALAWRRKAPFTPWFLVFLADYELHVLMDAFTYGRGVLLFWPFSFVRYESPFLLFMGVRWSEGLFSLQHVYTLASEAIFVLLVFFLARLTEAKLRPEKN